ncbi:type III secretion regulator YopN/LcrE/InvE/MxiC [Burkholderia ambifaria IOP40-10]|uniref:Type III secretion regulator YopN/LcrE/InvE/MxiC n=1 Tax=Burkholderia ambifaria IOP40-10 TaxID=396596 RepID=B1FB84_9BURK|nr:type III secretion system gatekeeper subunit SctW [Burkholderia ambifaria]EDT05166.1 type III secretion regulator YopN/LcrE/InvE/MxiC [Burkholderia ambifaria IOP40-10]
MAGITQNAGVGGMYLGPSLTGSTRLDRDASLDEAPDEQAELVNLAMQAQLMGADDDAAALLAEFGRFRPADRRTHRSDDLERMLDPEAGEKLDDLAGALKRLSVSDTRNVAALLREVLQRFPDPSDALLALRELRRRRALDNESVEFIDQAIDEWMQGNQARPIKAGVNVALKARAFGAQLRLDPRQLRQLYRQFLELEESYRMVYEYWIEEFGAARRKRILAFIAAALKYDMQSLDPSCGCAAEFGPLLTMTRQLRVLSSADAIFVGRLLEKVPQDAQLVSEEQAVRLMLAGLQRPYALETVLAEWLGPVLRVLPPARRIDVMQRVSRAFGTLPVSIYDDLEERQAVIDTLRELMDALHADEQAHIRRVALSRSEQGDGQ